MQSRHQSRVVALQIIFQYDQPTLPMDLDATEGMAQLTPWKRRVQEYFDHFQTEAQLRPFAAELALGTLSHLAELDPLIENASARWRLKRLAGVDRCVLRLSCFELCHMPNTPTSVIINEALELAKRFGAEQAPSFINGVLDAIRKGVRVATPAI